MLGLGLKLTNANTIGAGGQWWRAPKHRLDSASPFAVLSPASGRSMLNGRAVNDNALVSRQGGIKYVVGVDGVLSAVPANTLAYDWSSGVRELLFEGQATNQAPNSAMVGAALGPIGGAGALPTFWLLDAAPGLNYEIVEAGDGLGIRIHGTAEGTFTNILFGGPVGGASFGDPWVASCWCSLMAGSTAGLEFAIALYERNEAGAYIDGQPDPTRFVLGHRKRIEYSRPLGRAGVATINAGFLMTFALGTPIDVTIGIIGPQLEKGSVATSYIPTSGAAVTRTADVAPLWSGAGIATAWAWRGVIPVRAADWLPILMAGDWAIFSGDNGTPSARIGLWGNIDQSGVIPDVAAIPGGAGFAGGWGAAGRRASSLGSAAVADTKLVNRDLANLYVAGASGLILGQVLRLRELVAWQLPDRPSAAGCQAQARLWSA